MPKMINKEMSHNVKLHWLTFGSEDRCESSFGEAVQSISVAVVLFASSMTKLDETWFGDELILSWFAVLLAFMLTALAGLSAPSEHSELVQNCDDVGCHRALIKSGIVYAWIIVLSSFLLRTLGDGKQLELWGQQVRSMHRVVLNTLNSTLEASFLAFTGMNKHAYSSCIKAFEIPYRVMFIHLTTSTSIRAIDDLQSN